MFTGGRQAALVVRLPSRDGSCHARRHLVLRLSSMSGATQHSGTLAKRFLHGLRGGETLVSGDPIQVWSLQEKDSRLILTTSICHNLKLGAAIQTRTRLASVQKYDRHIAHACDTGVASSWVDLSRPCLQKRLLCDQFVAHGTHLD